MSIIKHVTLQKIVAHDFRYVPRISILSVIFFCNVFHADRYLARYVRVVENMRVRVHVQCPIFS